MLKKRIIISGIGVVSPIGIGGKEFWNSLMGAVSGVKPISNFKVFDKNCNDAAEIRGLNFERLLGKKGLRHTDKCTRFLLVAAKLALEDVKSRGLLKNYSSIGGVVTGTDWGYLDNNYHFYNEILTNGPSGINPMDFPCTLANFASSQVGIRFGLSGMNATVSRGFSSGLDAIGYAVGMINNYGVKRLLVGAAETLNIKLYSLFHKTGWLSKPTQNIKTGSILFNKGKGMVLGEGACTFILEEGGPIKKKSKHAFAEIKGYGFSFGNNKKDMKRSVYSTLENAKISPEEIDYICANANGHIHKDKDEFDLINEMFRDSPSLIVSSIKPNTGECFGASPAMQVAATCFSLREGLIPPTLYCKKGSSKPVFRISNRIIKKRINVALVNSFGLDGNNSCLILKRT